MRGFLTKHALQVMEKAAKEKKDEARLQEIGKLLDMNRKQRRTHFALLRKRATKARLLTRKKMLRAKAKAA